LLGWGAAVLRPFEGSGRGLQVASPRFSFLGKRCKLMAA